MDSKHTVRSYDEELEKLRSTLADMGSASVGQLARTFEALLNLDLEAAKEVVAKDEAVDRLQAEVDDLTVLMLAKRQPLAQDLRVIVTGQRIAASLERISDYSTSIARHVIAIEDRMIEMPMAALEKMGSAALSMLRGVLEAYTEVDIEKAMEIWHRDDEIDGLYSDLLEKLPDVMQGCDENIRVCTRLLFVARCCERIGDHITNIAESIYYIGTGEIYRTRAAE